MLYKLFSEGIFSIAEGAIIMHFKKSRIINCSIRINIKCVFCIPHKK